MYLTITYQREVIMVINKQQVKGHPNGCCCLIGTILCLASFETQEGFSQSEPAGQVERLFVEFTISV
jgi:hypothetical protein